MNQDQLKGKAEQLKGKGKQAVSNVSGNQQSHAEGAGDRVKGAVREAAGKAKEALSDVKNNVSKKVDKITRS